MEVVLAGKLVARRLRPGKSAAVSSSHEEYAGEEASAKGGGTNHPEAEPGLSIDC